MFKRILVAAMLAFIPLNVSSPTEAAVQITYNKLRKFNSKR